MSVDSRTPSGATDVSSADGGSLPVGAGSVGTNVQSALLQFLHANRNFLHQPHVPKPK